MIIEVQLQYFFQPKEFVLGLFPIGLFQMAPGPH